MNMAMLESSGKGPKLVKGKRDKLSEDDLNAFPVETEEERLVRPASKSVLEEFGSEEVAAPTLTPSTAEKKPRTPGRIARAGKAAGETGVRALKNLGQRSKSVAGELAEKAKAVSEKMSKGEAGYLARINSGDNAFTIGGRSERINKKLEQEVWTEEKERELQDIKRQLEALRASKK